MLGCMVTAMALISSCSGEDGKDGLNGTNGTNGVDGATGPAGSDGIACWDLNANGVGDIEEDMNGDEFVDALDCQGPQGEAGPAAQRIIVDTTGETPGATSIELDVPELTQAVLDTHIVLTYITDGSNFWSIPAAIPTAFFNFDLVVRYEVGLIEIRELIGTGWDPDLFPEVHIVLIETASMGGKSQADVMASLKAAQVDVNNYEEVKKFFGLK